MKTKLSEERKPMGSEIVKAKEGLGQLVAKHNKALAANPRPIDQEYTNFERALVNKVENTSLSLLGTSCFYALIGVVVGAVTSIFGNPVATPEGVIEVVLLPAAGGGFISLMFAFTKVNVALVRIIKRIFPKWAKKREHLHLMKELDRDLDLKNRMILHEDAYGNAVKELAPVLEELNSSDLAKIGNIEYVLTDKGVTILAKMGKIEYTMSDQGVIAKLVK